MWVCGGSFRPWSGVAGFSGGSAAGEVDLVLREPVEGRLGQAEVLRQERLGRVADPVGDAERAELREVAVVEDQDEVRRLVSQAFEHVAVAAGKIPHVARLEVVRLGVPLRVDDRGPDPPLDHERPLGRGGVPVELAHGTGLEPHRDAGDPLGDRQLLDGRLLAEAAGDPRPCDFSSANLKVGSSLPASNGSGTLFLNGNSSSAAAGNPTTLAAAAAEPINPRRDSSDMVYLLSCSLLGWFGSGPDNRRVLLRKELGT